MLPVGGDKDSASSVFHIFVEDLVHLFEGRVDPKEGLGGGGPILSKGVLFLSPVAAESGVGRASKGVDGGGAWGKIVDDGIPDLVYGLGTRLG